MCVVDGFGDAFECVCVSVRERVREMGKSAVEKDLSTNLFGRAKQRQTVRVK